MANTMAQQQESLPVRSLDNVRPEMAKAGLVRTVESDGVGSSDPIGRVGYDAVIAHYGSVKEAAYALGKVDPSLMRRELLEQGRFARLDIATDAAMVKAKVAEAMSRAYTPLSTPQSRLRQKARDLREIANEIEQAAELVA